MGVYTEKFREYIDGLPKEPKDFTDQVHAASAMGQLTNSCLRTLAALEEALEDAQKEVERLQEQLIEGGHAVSADIGEWWKK